MKFITILNKDSSLVWINIEDISAIIQPTIEEDDDVCEVILKNGKAIKLTCTPLDVFDTMKVFDETADFNDIA